MNGFFVVIRKSDIVFNLMVSLFFIIIIFLFFFFFFFFVFFFSLIYFLPCCYSIFCLSNNRSHNDDNNKKNAASNVCVFFSDIIHTDSNSQFHVLFYTLTQSGNKFSDRRFMSHLLQGIESCFEKL